MATQQEAKGSILLKLLIVILSIILVIVIIVPGKIWEQERQEELKARANMMSIYEAEKYFKELTGHFTTDPGELLSVVHSDSALIRKQRIVNYTRSLLQAFDQLLNDSYIRNLVRISKNMQQIIDDLEGNRYNFRSYEAINNEAETIKIQVVNFLNSGDFVYFSRAIQYSDSLVTLRSNLSDFTLQVAALKASSYADSLILKLQKADVAKAMARWSELTGRIANLIKMIKKSDLIKVTSVADRIEDFRKIIDNSMENLQINSYAASENRIRDRVQKLHELYQSFLQDYPITSQNAMYSLSESDSLIIHLTESNFFSPVNGEMYKILFDQDSQFVRVESPVLLKELREKVSPIAQELENLGLIQPYQEYFQALDVLLAKVDSIRKVYRRNTDLYIGFVELREDVRKLQSSELIKAYHTIKNFTSMGSDCESFGRIKDSLKKTIESVQIFEQVLDKNLLSILDSGQVKIDAKIANINNIFQDIRRNNRRAKIESLEQEQQKLATLVENIKKISSHPSLVEKLRKLEDELSNAFVFASEGKKNRVYGIFDKQIKNFGYIYKDIKSWEEED